jgi:hypothetical protein
MPSQTDVNMMLCSRRMQQKGMLDSVQLAVYRIARCWQATFILLLALRRRRFFVFSLEFFSFQSTNSIFLQYLDVAQKILKNDKVLSQKCANVPNAVEESSCLMQADSNFMYVGKSQPLLVST